MSSQAFTPQQVIEERNARLMAWLADELKLSGQKRQQLYTEMTQACRQGTDKVVVEYLWKKLAPKDIEAVNIILKRFHDIAYGWFANTADDRRN